MIPDERSNLICQITENVLSYVKDRLSISIEGGMDKRIKVSLYIGDEKISSGHVDLDVDMDIE